MNQELKGMKQAFKEVNLTTIGTFRKNYLPHTMKLPWKSRQTKISLVRFSVTKCSTIRPSHSSLNENVATPRNYRLGPGDEVVIDIWGANEDHIRQSISPEGSIMVSQIGPVYLSGMTIEEAGNHIRSSFQSKYAGIGGEQPDSEIAVTLGNIRTIQVDIMGEVAIPGTYRLSPFSTVFHACTNREASRHRFNA